MKDKQRVLLIQEACRLVNLLQRTRLQPDQFVARYRREIDRVMAPILPKPKKNKWHTWEELPSRRKAKIIKSLLRDGVTSVAQSDISRLRILPISYDQIRDIVSDRTKASRWHGIHRRAKMFPGWNTPWPDPLGTPATRIKAKRLKASRSIYNERLHTNYTLNVEFLPDLHPTDVEFHYEEHNTTLHITADRLAASKSAMLKDCIIAATSVYSDENQEVYQCSVLIAGDPPRAELCYIGRSIVLCNPDGIIFRDPTWAPTPSRYKTAMGALQAARKLYAASAARIINGVGQGEAKES